MYTNVQPNVWNVQGFFSHEGTWYLKAVIVRLPSLFLHGYHSLGVPVSWNLLHALQFPVQEQQTFW